MWQRSVAQEVVVANRLVYPMQGNPNFGIRNNFVCAIWNCWIWNWESWALKSGIQIKESEIAITIDS